MLAAGVVAIEPLIRVEDLTKHFAVTKGLLVARTTGQVKAVDGVSFTIGRQETLGLVGESGCGKTTTARLLLRLERPTAGRVLLDGRDVHALAGPALRDYRTKVQAVFQDPWSSLNPRRRVRDTIAEALIVNRRVSSSEIRERVAEVLDQHVAIQENSQKTCSMRLILPAVARRAFFSSSRKTASSSARVTASVSVRAP